MTLQIIHSKHKEMNNLQRFNYLSFANYMASLRETERVLTEKTAENDRLIKETDRQMKETDRQMKDTDRRLKETDRLIKESCTNSEKERKQSRKEAERERRQARKEAEQERKRTSQKFELYLKKSQEKFDKQMKKSNKKFDWKMEMADKIFDREWKAFKKEMGGIGNNNGELAEEYFFNTFRKDKTFANEKFERVLRNRMIKNCEWDAEFDIVMFNDKSAAIIEVKYRATKENITIGKLLSRVEPFKALFPHCKNHNIYLGVAAMSFHKDVAWRLQRAGIATIHQVGKKMVVYNETLKAF
jgi:tRNA uridine 5-carbamoylmethylation protein Kti12